MELNQLHCFCVTAKTENITKAAEQLYISQPSLSQTIHRLEEELGYPLFDREGRHIQLNRAGKTLLVAAEQVEGLLTETKLKIEEENGKSHPEVEIYIGCASMLLPELLKYLKQQNPQTKYKIRQWNQKPGQMKEVISIHAQEGEGELLMEENILLALPRKHPLVQKTSLYLDDLYQEEFICLNESWELGKKIEAGLQRKQISLEVTMQVDNPNLMRELLKNGLGVAFVPEITWHSFAGEEVIMREVKDWQLTRKVRLSYPKETALSREQKACIAGIQSFFQMKKETGQ